MLTLFVDINGWKQVELYQNEPVNLNYTFTDVSEVNKPASSYSQSFRLPLTKANQDVFGVFGLGQVPDLNYKQRIPARIMRGGVTLMEGFGQIKKYYLQRGEYQDIEFCIFGETANLSRAVGDSKLQDLDLSAFNFALNSTNTSDALSTSGLAAGKIRLGVVDRVGYTDALNPFNDSLLFTPSDFTPFVQVKFLLDTIFDEAGLSYESDFFDSSAIEDLYLMALSGERLYTQAEYQTQAIYVGQTTEQSVTDSTWTALDMIETTPYYDDISAWSTDTFTAPVSGTYVFYLQANHTSSSEVDARLSASASGVIFAGSFSAGITNTLLIIVPLQASETVEFQVYGDSGDFDILANLRLMEYFQTDGFTLDLAKNLPDLRQIDFVSGLQKCFNLVFIPDRNRPTHFYIEPWADYMTAGATKNWTSKLDTAKDITIEPTTDLQKRKYIWTHTESEDILNAAAKSSTGEVYGAKNIEDSGNAYAAGDLKTVSPFAPFIIAPVGETGIAIHSLLKLESDSAKAISKPKPFLAFFNGLQGGSVYYEVGGVSTNKPLPYYSAAEKYVSTVGDLSLNFGHPTPYHFVFETPLNALYYRWWSSWANELFSSDARILEGFFYLTSSDLATFEWSDKIYLFNQYWRIIEIQGYDATRDGLTKVKLVKILGSIQDCEQLPSTASRGLIQGTPTSLSKKCCERYGYTFDPNTKRCLQPIPLER